MERQILHVAIPFFPIALARATDPQLRERPVAVAPGNSERTLLQCVSSEAAAEGISAGTPLFLARKICPSLIVVPPDPLLVARGNRLLGELSAQFSPVVEPAGGRVFLDLTGGSRLFGPPRDVAARLEAAIAARLGLEARAGSGINKLVSRLAADVLPERGVYDVFPGSERNFLAPFPISVLPGIGRERQGLLLRDLNLQRVEQVALLTVAQLRLAVGPFAPLLHERACGIDRSPVQPPRQSSEIVEEAFLEQEENDDAVLLAELYRLVEGCGMRLRRCGTEADKLELTVNHADGVAAEGRKRLRSPQSLDLPLFAAAEELFFATCTRRVRVRSIRLACSRSGRQKGQLELFSGSGNVIPGQTALQEALDLLREKHGSAAVRWGRTIVASPAACAVAAESPPSWDPTETRYMTLTKRGK